MNQNKSSNTAPKSIPTCAFPFSSMFNKQQFSDIIVRLKDGREFYCHKAVLAGGSEMLEKMLTDIDGGQTPTCELVIFDASAVEVVLRYFYGEMPTNIANYSAEKWSQVIRTAHSWMVANLVEHFCDNLSANVSYLDLIQLGHEINVPKLVTIAVDLVAATIKKETISNIAEGIHSLSISATQEFMVSASLRLTQYELLALACHYQKDLPNEFINQFSLCDFTISDLESVRLLPGFKGVTNMEYMVNQLITLKICNKQILEISVEKDRRIQMLFEDRKNDGSKFSFNRTPTQSTKPWSMSTGGR